jgi:pimeloyl-ACP methyl ester carboxylesterase
VAVPLEELYAQALASKKRLVLAGHSLGGAVALLCTIKLLRIWAARQLGGAYALAAAPAAAAAAPAGAAPAGRGGGKGGRGSGRQGRQRRNNQHLAAAAAAAAADPTADPNVRCITFAAPAVANESLAAEVVAAGWDRLMSNFVQPGARGGGWGWGTGAFACSRTSQSGARARLAAALRAAWLGCRSSLTACRSHAPLQRTWLCRL